MAVFPKEKQGRISANARLVKTMQERNHKGKADSKQRTKRRNVLAKKIGAMICACSRRRKARQMCVYKSEKPRGCMEQKETSISQENHELALNKSSTCVENQANRVRARDGRNKGSGRKSKKQSCKAGKQRFIVLSGLSGIFRSTGFSLRKWKAIKSDYTNGSKGSGLNPIYWRIKRAKLRIKKEVRPGEKMKKKHEEKESEAEVDNRELELCKKRILLGEKCRPLNISGALHYDEEGILLPEDFLPSEES